MSELKMGFGGKELFSECGKFLNLSSVDVLVCHVESADDFLTVSFEMFRR